MGLFSFIFKKKIPKKPKIGLALGSGGAKGYAELGVIKVLEENGIYPDVIGGTSIGSIIGAFLADGYTSTDIASLLETVDFKEIKSALMINMDTSGLKKVIDRYIGGLKIEELKKPFVAIGTDADTAEEFVFTKGSVADALRASSAFPPFFKPVPIGDGRYVDGAFSNSVPADRVKELGADIVIGVDLSDHQPKTGFLASVIPTFKAKTDAPWEKGYKFSDVMIHPDLAGYSSTSFKDGATMYEIGYAAAKEKIEEIRALIDSFGKVKKRKK